MVPVVFEGHSRRIGVIEHRAGQLPGGVRNVQHNAAGTAPDAKLGSSQPQRQARSVFLLIAEHEHAADIQRYTHALQGLLQKGVHIIDAHDHFRNLGKHFFIGNTLFNISLLCMAHSVRSALRETILIYRIIII